MDGTARAWDDSGILLGSRSATIWRVGLAAVYEFVRKQNIERLKKQLAAERDPEKRKVIEALLADHESGDPIRHREVNSKG